MPSPLAHLLRVAKTMPEERLDMSVFTTPGYTPACKTKHCLAGWAALDPQIAVETRIRDIFDVYADEIVTLKERTGVGYLTTTQRLAQLFGITDQDSDILFALKAGDQYEYVEKDDVIRNVVYLLMGNSCALYPEVIYEVDDECDEDDEPYYE